MSGWGVALGLALGTAMAAPGDLRWEFATGAFIRSTPAIGDDGTVYFGSGGGGLYAVDGATGQERWRLATGPIVGSPVIGPNGLVYVAEWEFEQWNQSPGVYGVDARTGARKWGFNPQYAGGFRASPAVGQNGLLHVVSERGWWYVLNAETGQGRRVSIPEDWGQYSSPVVGADGILYLGMPERGLFALDPSTGVRLWVHRPEIVWNGGPGPVGGFHASPAVGRDGTLYLGSTDGSLYAFDPFTGAVQWRAPTGGPITSSAAVGPDGIVYFGSNDKRVRAVEGATGLLRWEFAAGAGVHSTPTLTADGTLYLQAFSDLGGWRLYALGGESGALRWKSEHTVYHTLIGVGGVIYGLVAAGSAETWALHPDTGKALWRSPFSGQLILGADQTLYVLAYDGQVVALDAGSGQESAPASLALLL